MISELRKSYGLTQKDLGKRIEKSENYIKRLEKDFVKTNPTIKIIGKLAETFDMSPYSFYCKMCKTYIRTDCKKDMTYCIAEKNT